MSTRRFGPYTVDTSNEDKVLFPDAGITKGELIDYYARVADVMIPYLRHRPLTMQRFPDGIGKEGFYHKDAPRHFPEWIERARLAKSAGGTVDYVVCDNAATLVFLADQACITPHVWLSRRDAPRRPDRVVIDLDPSGGDFEPVRRAARRASALLGDLGLRVFLQLTGSRGIHVVTPIRRDAEFERAREFARDVARHLAARYPDELTTEQRKDKRGDRVYLDTGRNAYGQTMVAPYAVRARPGAPVATPIEPDELGDPGLDPRGYTIRNLFSRLGRCEDPWRAMGRSARSLDGPRRALAER